MSQCDQNSSCCISGDAPWRDEHCGTIPTSLAHFYQRLLAKNVRWPDDVIMWPQMTFQWEIMQQRAKDIKHNLSGYVGTLTRARTGVWATFPRPGGGWPPPQRTRILRKIAKSGKRRSIGRGKFYKKYPDNFLIRSNLRSQVTNTFHRGPKKVQFSQNRAIFTEDRNYQIY